MGAKLLLRDKFVYKDGAIREMVIWLLPTKSTDRPHGIKYRLFYGQPQKETVRYDNESGKGDHRHLGENEENYSFSSVEQLIADFRADIATLREMQ